MDTVSKGRKFERIVFDYLSNLVKRNEFWSRAELTKVYSRKKYFSKDRGSYIEVDVSIEIFLPNQEKPSIIVLVECKDYSSSIPVDDIEEFYAKIQQITGANVKGIFATTSAFQPAGLQYCESKQIGLLRYFDKSEFRWELTRSPATYWGDKSRERIQLAFRALTSEDFASNYFDCYFKVGNVYTTSLFHAIENLVLSGNFGQVESVTSLRREGGPPEKSVPYIQRSRIESVVAETLGSVKYEQGEVPLEKVCESLRNTNGLSVIEKPLLNDNSSVLGKISFADNTITLYVSENQYKPRLRFTLAHELGHYLLGHDKFMFGETFSQDELYGYGDDRVWLLNEDICRLEWQANFFASSLLLPEAQLLNVLFTSVSELKLLDRGHGILYVDDQPVNLHSYYEITSSIMSTFNVSRSVAKMRLIQLGYLKDERKADKELRHISQYELIPN